MVMFTFPMKFLRCWDWSRNQFVAVLRPRMRTRTWWRRRQNNGMISQQTSAGNFNEQQSNRIEMIWTCCKCHKCHSSETLIYLGILGFFLLNLDETSTMKSMRMFDTSIFPIFFPTNHRLPKMKSIFGCFINFFPWFFPMLNLEEIPQWPWLVGGLEH